MLCESYVAARLDSHDCTRKDGARQEMSEVLGSCLLPGILGPVMQQRCSAAGVSPARQGARTSEPRRVSPSSPRHGLGCHAPLQGRKVHFHGCFPGSVRFVTGEALLEV